MISIGCAGGVTPLPENDIKMVIHPECLNCDRRKLIYNILMTTPVFTNNCPQRETNEEDNYRSNS